MYRGKESDPSIQEIPSQTPVLNLEHASLCLDNSLRHNFFTILTLKDVNLCPLNELSETG